MSNIVKINDSDVRVIEYQNRRVVTLAQVDTVHARPKGTARRNFNVNHGRLIEGEDYARVSAYEIRSRFPGAIPERSTAEVTVLFESGYLMLVKSFTDDLAWSVQRQLVKGYFRGQTSQAVAVYSVGVADKLTAEEADQLRDMMREGLKHLPASQQGAAMTQGWSKMKAHFKVKYREIPRHEFPEALSLLSRHLANWTPASPALLAPPAEPLHRALDSMHLMAASMADLSSAVFHLVERQKGEGLNGGNRQPFGEASAAATAQASVITPL